MARLVARLAAESEAVATPLRRLSALRLPTLRLSALRLLALGRLPRLLSSLRGLASLVLAL